MYPILGRCLYDFNTGTHTYIWIYLMFLRKYTFYSNMLNLFCSIYNEELSIILGWCTMASLLKEGQTCWIWHFKFDTLKIMSNELFFCSVCWGFCLIFSDKMFSNRPERKIFRLLSNYFKTGQEVRFFCFCPIILKLSKKSNLFCFKY